MREDLSERTVHTVDTLESPISEVGKFFAVLGKEIALGVRSKISYIFDNSVKPTFSSTFLYAEVVGIQWFLLAEIDFIVQRALADYKDNETDFQDTIIAQTIALLYNRIDVLGYSFEDHDSRKTTLVKWDALLVENEEALELSVIIQNLKKKQRELINNRALDLTKN